MSNRTKLYPLSISLFSVFSSLTSVFGFSTPYSTVETFAESLFGGLGRIYFDGFVVGSSTKLGGDWIFYLCFYLRGFSFNQEVKNDNNVEIHVNLELCTSYYHFHGPSCNNIDNGYYVYN